MPTYQHECTDESCKHEWEDFYSMSQQPPKVCPQCHKETAKRVISATGGGRVLLTGDDLLSSLKQDVSKMKKDIYSSEKNYANVLGEDRYQTIQKQLDSNKKQ